MVEQKRFGKQVTWIEEPDVFCMRIVGVVDGDELAGILEEIRVWSEGKSNTFALTDLSGVSGATSSAKKMLNEVRPIPNSISVTYGANFAVRILADMMYRARRLLRREKSAESAMFATESEARAFIEKRRTELEDQLAGGEAPSAA